VRGGKAWTVGGEKQRADALRGGVATFALHHFSTVLNPQLHRSEDPRLTRVTIHSLHTRLTCRFFKDFDLS